MIIFRVPVITSFAVYMDVTNVIGNLKMNVEYYTNVSGERYFNVTKAAVTLTYEDVDLRFEKGSPNTFRELLKTFVKRHIRTIFDRILPQIERGLANVIQDFANNHFFSGCPAQMFLY